MTIDHQAQLDLGNFREKHRECPAPDTLSAFRLRVYAYCQLVPAGQVTTYGALALAVGCKSSRAIGNALRHNPYAPRVPCHRVIRSGWCCFCGLASLLAGVRSLRVTAAALCVCVGVSNT
jgi:O-6-methylguanine DNA methyltransferase